MKKIIKIILGSFGILAAIPIMLVGGIAVFCLVPLPGAQSRFAAKAREGTPIVEAIYAYRNATELFPETIDDLSRVTSIKFDPARWSYVWGTQSSVPRLTSIGSGAPGGLSYLFAELEAGWGIHNHRYRNMKLDVVIEIPVRPERTQAERLRLIVAEIERRIARDGTKLIHHQGLITHQIQAGDLAGALASAIRLHERGLDPWWELQILARLLHRSGQENWAEKAMRAEAIKNPSFLPFFYLAWFYREAGDPKAALQALTEASAHTFRELGWNGYVDDHFFWLATIYAYSEQQPELVLALCDRWEENDAKRGYGSPNPQALRAAAHLALGNLTQARSSIDRAILMKGNLNIWAEHLDELSDAIRRSDPSYRWNPGSYPELDGYELLISYQ